LLRLAIVFLVIIFFCFQDRLAVEDGLTSEETFQVLGLLFFSELLDDHMEVLLQRVDLINHLSMMKQKSFRRRFRHFEVLVDQLVLLYFADFCLQVREVFFVALKLLRQICHVGI